LIYYSIFACSFFGWSFLFALKNIHEPSSFHSFFFFFNDGDACIDRKILTALWRIVRQCSDTTRYLSNCLDVTKCSQNAYYKQINPDPTVVHEVLRLKGAHLATLAQTILNLSIHVNWKPMTLLAPKTFDFGCASPFEKR